MRAVLEITSGPDAGRKAWLRDGQSLDVGRTDEAAFVVSHDRRMSSRHFELRCDRGVCRLRDLGSSNGTSVNGIAVTETPLRDADTILAGNTSFALHLEGAGNPVAPTHPATPKQPLPTAAPEIAPSSEKRLGGWVCPSIPIGWQPADHGFRQTAGGRFPATLILIEAPAPENTSLSQYVQLQSDQFAKSLPGAAVDGPRNVSVAGAEEALEFTLRHPPQGRFVLVQRYICARRKSILATCVFTTSLDDSQTRAAEYEQLLRQLMLSDG
jgi:hypothetical protein